VSTDKINLETAKTIGITMPPALLARAASCRAHAPTRRRDRSGFVEGNQTWLNGRGTICLFEPMRKLLRCKTIWMMSSRVGPPAEL
jgi:hypothetical protein